MKRPALILIFAACATGGESASEAYEPPKTNVVREATMPEAAPPKKAAANNIVPTAAKVEPEKKAGMGKYSRIIDRAPFRNTLVPSTVAGAPTGNSSLKLNGIIRIGNRLLAGIEDSTVQRSTILAVGQNDQGIEVQAIDEATQTVTLTQNGVPATLALEKPPAIGSPPALLAGTPPGVHSIPPQPGPIFQPPPGSTNEAPGLNTKRRKRLIVPRTQ